MVSRTFNILFFVRKQKESKENTQENQNKKAPIYIRITVDGKRAEVTTKREIDPTKWNRHAGRAHGTKEEIKTLNAYLDTLERKLHQVHQEVIESNKPFTVDTIKNRFLGIGEERPRMLVEIIQQHNDSIKKLIGLDYSRPTWVKYNTTQKHVSDFLAWKYGKEDIPIKELNYEFITDFDFYLKSEKRIDVNTNAKYIKNLKKIIRECV
ncbi:MAG TPA: phage integrase SAM-like domain and Arm DNA-binding domain-containing protein, partial [Flavisolibacter sp.]|nr:phage integrase SAM-like domain and Arm DNA-binding domain-containing protein [Flavisolibacter sp.]